MKRRFIMVLATWVILVLAFAQSFINLRKISSFTLDFWKRRREITAIIT
jgi:hypothetical protein